MVDVSKINRELKEIEDVIEGNCSEEKMKEYTSEIDALKNGLLIHKENMLILSVLESMKHEMRQLSRSVATATKK